MITSEENDRLSPGTAGSGLRAPSARVSLRVLARRPLVERHREVLASGIWVDATKPERGT